jgi:hypothetical protein
MRERGPAFKILQLLILVSSILPERSWIERRTLTTNLVLALLRWIIVRTEDAAPPDLAECIAEQEPQLMRPMIEQGLELAYPILQRGGLIGRV